MISDVQFIAIIAAGPLVLWAVIALVEIWRDEKKERTQRDQLIYDYDPKNWDGSNGHSF